MDFIYKKNDSVTVTIEDMGTEGEGIGKVDGFTLFIKDAVPGDVVNAKVIKIKKNYAYARLEKVITPSPFRVEPKCAYHRQCGGCQLQTLSYEKQLEFKQQKIRNSLIRIGGFPPEYIEERMDPIIGMEDPFRYRNKAQYPVGKNRDGDIITGFYAGRTHTIIANMECYLGAAENKLILDIILKHMRRFHISSYDENTGKGLVRHILIRKGFTSGEIMVCLVLNKNMKTHPGQNAGQYIEKDADCGMRQTSNETEHYCNKEFISGQDILLEELACVKGMTSVSVNINTERTNVIMGKEIYILWGSPVISDTIHVRDMQKEGYPFTGKELTFLLSPLSFYQVNPVQTEKLYSLALEYAQLTGEETVWDLYCGIGTISLFLAANAKKVYGVEVIPQAIEDARENARKNNIQNAEFILGKAEEVLPEYYERRGRFSDGALQSHPEVIVVDPPRKGCDEACLNTMLKMQPQRIVYVSCDPATLARDLKVLCDGGYEIRKIRGVDQFGMTVHVETVCLLSKLNIENHIEVDVNLDEMDLTAAESKATYEEIKGYVKEKMGLHVSNLYIAQVKRKCGIIERENYNKAKSEDAIQLKCPPEKEEAIMAALMHFRMV